MTVGSVGVSDFFRHWRRKTEVEMKSEAPVAILVTYCLPKTFADVGKISDIMNPVTAAG